jgi:DNA polymerase-1
MIMFQIGDENEQFVIDTRTISIEPLKEILESNEITKVLHNAKFDYKFIKRWSNIELQNIYDTYLGEKVLHCGKENFGFSLQACTQRYLEVSLNKQERNKFVEQSSTPFTHYQIEYGAKDVEYLIAIQAKQMELLTRGELQEVIKLENMATKVLAEIEYEGIQLDRGRWEELSKLNNKKANDLIFELDELVTTNNKLKNKYHIPTQIDMFAEVQRKTNINYDSPKQILELFQLLIPTLEDVNGKNLYKYRYKYPLINKYLEYKEVSKLYTTYGVSFFKYIKSDNKVHTSFQQILNTGRMSSSEPNMQQIPSDNKYRNCFICPTDYVFVSSDYSSQELNVIAYGSKDPVFLSALQNNEDLHSVCAELVFKTKWSDAALPDCKYTASKQKCNCPEHKKLRTQVKGINFGLAYGMGPHKLSDQLDIKLNEASDLIDQYFEAFPSIKNFLTKLGNYGKTHGYITTFPPFKRKRFFPEWDGVATEPKNKGIIERASKNTPIQG